MKELFLKDLSDIVEKMQWQYDNDIANINDKKYHLVDKDLLKYIRNLEKENAKQKELIGKIKEMFSKENINSYYYGDSYEFAIDDFEEDILDLIKEYEEK